jgi:hypothetical protein
LVAIATISLISIFAAVISNGILSIGMHCVFS